MKRCIVALILAMLIVASVVVLRDKPQNDGLPVVHAALKDFPRGPIFSPCPSGQFAPRPKRNVA